MACSTSAADAAPFDGLHRAPRKILLLAGFRQRDSLREVAGRSRELFLTASDSKYRDGPCGVGVRSEQRQRKVSAKSAEGVR